MLSTILQIIGGIACLLIGLIEALKEKSKKKQPAWIHWITFIGGALVLAGVYVSNIESNKFQKGIDNKTNILVGEKACFILFYGEPYKKNDQICFRSKLIKMGKLPVYDINIILFDLSKTIKNGNVNQSISDGRFIDTDHNSQNIEFGDLSGGYKELPLIVTTVNQDFYHYDILISTRNGSLFQEQYFKYVNNTWETACLVFDYGTNKLIDKNVSNNFPEDLIDLKSK
jgi:hypothetical protein